MGPSILPLHATRPSPSARGEEYPETLAIRAISSRFPSKGEEYYKSNLGLESVVEGLQMLSNGSSLLSDSDLPKSQEGVVLLFR